MRRPFMTDADMLRSLRGQQYVVLRPVADVETFYDEEQRSLRNRAREALPRPDTGHVTLRGFHEPERVQLLRDALAEWARGQTPIDLRVVAVDVFPPPFQIVIARAERTPSLVSAYASLTEVLDAGDFRRSANSRLRSGCFTSPFCTPAHSPNSGGRRCVPRPTRPRIGARRMDHIR